MQQNSIPNITQKLLGSFYALTFCISEYLRYTPNCFGDMRVKFRKKENPIQYKISKLKDNEERCSDGK